MRAHNTAKERLVLTDVARSFRPKTLRKDTSMAATILSTAALATTVWLRVFGSRHIVLTTVEVCAAVGMIGGLTQSAGLVGLAAILSVGLVFAGIIKTSPIIHAIILSPRGHR